MAREKVTEEVETSTQEVKEPVKKVEKSEEYIALEKIFAEYKERNPRKYEIKKEEFARKLSALADKEAKASAK